MKHLYLNLKRFDVPVELGGVNRRAPRDRWAHTIVTQTQEGLRPLAGDAEVVQFFPEMHLLQAVSARQEDSPVQIGAQGA